MELTRRAFLSVASTALLGCAASRSTAHKDIEIESPRAARRILRPPPGKVLFIAGQGAAQIGGNPAAGWGDGYLDHIPTRPGGFTDYCSVASGPDCAGLSRVADLPALKDSVLHLSVTWIDDFPPLACPKENNQLITTGAFDDNIDRLARWCAAQPRPILTRIGFEFDRAVPFPDYHYDPAWFALGFRRIVDRLRKAGADNVSTVLASTNVSPALTVEKFNRFYPGDDYVDWLGCSMWNPTTIDHVILSEARKRNKPVMLAETTPTKFNIGQSLCYPFYVGASRTISAQAIWDGWHQPMIDFLHTNRDCVAAWHYIATDWSTDPLWNSIPIFAHCDARPWADPEFLAIWNQHMNAAPFLQASASLFRELGY